MIRRTLYNFIKWIYNYQHENEIYAKTAVAGNTIRVSDEADIDGLRFTVMPARGGTIIQMRTYDRKRDENNHTTYVIPEGADIAVEVGRIVSLELIKA